MTKISNSLLPPFFSSTHPFHPPRQCSCLIAHVLGKRVFECTCFGEARVRVHNFFVANQCKMMVLSNSWFKNLVWPNQVFAWILAALGNLDSVTPELKRPICSVLRCRSRVEANHSPIIIWWCFAWPQHPKEGNEEWPHGGTIPPARNQQFVITGFWHLRFSKFRNCVTLNLTKYFRANRRFWSNWFSNILVMRKSLVSQKPRLEEL